jgi:hypothetical protein
MFIGGSDSASPDRVQMAAGCQAGVLVSAELMEDHRNGNLLPPALR